MSFQKVLSLELSLRNTFHPYKDGQAERTIQTLEDMLIACVNDFNGNWYDHIPLIEFGYNNNYHLSIQMAPCEAICRRRCNLLVGGSMLVKDG